jgi:predicted dithiol-disulfide oxidoreductase (DUF899 family)
MKKKTAIEQRVERAERELLTKKDELLQLRKKLPKQHVKDYILKDQAGRKVKLSSIFGASDELILVHNMGRSCPYCTLWADGFNGIVDHLRSRAAFAVVSPDDPKTQRTFAKGRGWKFKMFSVKGTDFNRDLDFADEKGHPWPGVSAFQKTPKGSIYRVAKAYFGPGDDYSAIWHMFALLPRGVDGWEPKYKYGR